ncbi:hypothetical protein ASF27_01715 [Methylobacterium sp. Leaf102]|uniref:gene transfer agent family protein n=1 Tax=Methylobacterium sp. Leaf102 TaxID=1736253 RepID=UPI0006FCD121|nr:gene transfer agent family protein [Methylobacterium sp. Leaf102]KQP34304.1 hypothetical protein ASF27_01715 [Methylobacterium sp. Leaf102]
MSAIDTGRTCVDADFAGERRRFQLRLGEMGELERLTGIGIGAIFMRMGAHQFSHRDVWDTIRLGLEGGGTSALEATALVMRYHTQPLMDFLPLAASIVAAAVNGAPPGKSATEGGSIAPETSPSSTPAAPSSDGPLGKSTG